MVSYRVLTGVSLLMLALATPGCRLIDQRTFAPTPSGPTGAALARPDLPPLPLVTIRLTNPDVDWRSTLDEAVHAAVLRKPEVSFEVLTPVPTRRSPAEQDRFVRTGTADAQMVAEALQADGIAPDHITLGLQDDAGAPGREVRLYAH
jgi:hypothetical protein